MIENTNQLGDLLNFEQELYKDKTPKEIIKPTALDDLELLEDEVSTDQKRQRYGERAGIAYDG